MSESKQYGLILPDKQKSTPVFQANRNVFGDESDSDDNSKNAPVLCPSGNVKRQARIIQEKAVLEDPSVYQYDEVYDEMVNKKKDAISKSKTEKKPRYIEKLMETANKRKKENEKRVERQIQKERAEEGDEFADKEVFVTSAYQKKLEERRLEEELEKREEYLESIGDVKKQKDLGGFYRHIYEQRNAPEDKHVKDSLKLSDESSKKSNAKDEKVGLPVDQTKKKKEDSKSRNYRKRMTSSEMKDDLSDGEIVSDEEIRLPNLEDIRAAKLARKNETGENIDADSDFSIDSSDSEDTEPTAKKHKHSQGQDKENVRSKDKTQEQKNDTDEIKTKTDDIISNDNSVKVDSGESKAEKENVSPAEEKPKIDIWKKRTVGIVFDQALQRYYERKALRGH